VRELPEAIAQMVDHAYADFESMKRRGKVTPEWEADYNAMMSLFTLAHIAWNEVIEDSASWTIIRETIAFRWEQYTGKHPVAFTKSELIQQFLELHPEEAHTWSPQKIAEYLQKHGVDVQRTQVYRVMHKPGH
jgi:hypothetical protein